MESPQPEIERPRSLAEILAEALDIYQRYPGLVLTLALGVIGPYELAVLAATGEGPLATQSHQKAGVTILLALLNYALIAPLISALLIYAVIVIGQGRGPRLTEVAARGLRVLPEVAAAVIAAGFGIGLGLLLIIPGILLALRWSVVAQVAAVDHEGWLPALKRSGELAREPSTVDDQVFLADRPAVKPALEDLASSCGVARLGGQARAGGVRGHAVMGHRAPRMIPRWRLGKPHVARVARELT
jgi:hypothetical protein